MRGLNVILEPSIVTTTRTGSFLFWRWTVHCDWRRRCKAQTVVSINWVLFRYVQ